MARPIQGFESFGQMLGFQAWYVRPDDQALGASSACQGPFKAGTQVTHTLVLDPAESQGPTRVLCQLRQAQNLPPLKLPGGTLANPCGQPGFADTKMRLLCEDNYGWARPHERKL